MASQVVNKDRPTVAPVVKAVFEAECSVSSNASLGLSGAGSHASPYASAASHQFLFSQHISQPHTMLSHVGVTAHTTASSLLNFRMDQLSTEDGPLQDQMGDPPTCFTTDAECHALWTARCISDDAVLPARPLNGNVKML